MNRYRLTHLLSAIAIALIAGGILTYILATVLGMSSLSTGIVMSISWGLAALIGLGLLLRAILPRRTQHGDGVGVEGGIDPVNDLYLGRVRTTPITRSVDEYSALPPPEDLHS
ncbi:hypothetical protein [Microbacterium panaciterrae]|uniref:Phage holin family protein n=1 Tax=Microbacterium panaciterrae TaxID=985759 RepID=A0ABP8P888_9MICO